MRVENVKEFIFEQYLKNLIKQVNGTRYINEADFDKLKLNDLEKTFALTILKEKNIEIKKELIEKKDRSPLVRDYNYGEVFTNNLESRDVPVMADIDFDGDEIVREDYEKLEEFLELDFIPNHVQMKQKINKETKEVEYVPSIQLNHIVKLKLSELENQYVLRYLERSNIRVGGISPDLDSDREINNYDYIRTFKESAKPEYDSNLNDVQRIQQYQQTKDLHLREDIIKNNLRLVSWIAYKYSIITGINVHELESYGYEALINSIDTFDVSLGYKFSTYAVPRIRGKILRGIPLIEGYYKSNFYYDYIRCKNIVEEYNAETIDQNPKLLKDIFDLMVQIGKISPNGYEDFINLINVSKPEYLEDMDIIESEYDIDEDVLGKVNSELIAEVLKTLTPREERVIRLRFGLDDGVPKTLEEVGKIFNIGRERVRQIEAKALRKLRHPLRSKKISDEEQSRRYYA